MEEPLFTAGSIRCVELTREDLPSLQRFFEDNADYFVAVSGRPAGPDEAREELEQLPPAGWPYEKKWLLGFVAPDGALVAMSDLLSNLFAEGVWHVGLFIVATPLHGGGTAQGLYSRLESWMRDRGARWLRLGVVAGNTRAERFWDRQGYIQVRTRSGVEMGERVNTIRVMAKPLAGGGAGEYLALVPRDRPESP